MSIRRTFTLLSVVVFCITGTLIAKEAKEAKIDLSKAKCVVSGKEINPEAHAEYKGKKVFFCCPGCPNAFAKDTKKFAEKANHQLVLTGQVKQTGCPISGRATKDGTDVKVAGVAVQFCCPNCQGKVADAKGDAQLKLVFSDKSFEKGFKVAKKK